MPANLLVLPLLAGYLFVHFSTRFRYRAQSLDGYRLLIESAIAGAALLFLSRLIVLFIHGWVSPLRHLWQEFAGDVPYLGTAAGSLVLGLAIPFIDNYRPRYHLARRAIRPLLRWRRNRWARRLVIFLRRTYRLNRESARHTEIMLHGNALTRLLHVAGSEARLISVTLANRKWYAGYVAEAVNLEPAESYFRIFPILSGYRDKDDLRTHRVIFYEDVYRAESRKKSYDLSRFVVTLALADVQDARLYEDEVYREYFGEPEPVKPPLNPESDI